MSSYLNDVMLFIVVWMTIYDILLHYKETYVMLMVQYLVKI